MDEDQRDEFITELRDKVRILEDRNTRLMEEVRMAEGEKRYVESELFRLQKDVKRLRAEMERLKSPPLIIGTLKDILPDGRVIVKSSTGPDFIVSISEYVPPEDLIPGARVSLNKQTLAVMGVLPQSLDPIVTGAEIIEKPKVTYADIGGLEEQIRDVREAVEDPLLRPELYKKVGIEPPKGVLLVGPPGTGKTLLAKAVANATNATFIRLVGSELVQKYIGEGARLVRELFELANEKAPSIVFIDELDSIGAKRLDVATSGDREVQRTLMQLLAELDGFKPTGDVKIIGATNRPDILDEALLRPGRFDRIIEIGLPNYEGRLQILKIHTAYMNIDENVNLEDIAMRSEGASGAELRSICTEAGMFAIRNGRDKATMTDFEQALQKVLGNADATMMGTGLMFA
ncbi:MAG: proteasome regulatory subunit [Candidatus Methanomethylophilaceae archaeon]|nr:proteasome regulatory subunit [Candidatus Methanomethylophilaceae archaeon]MDI3541168.1 proteasome regulatory subunit [Candidatus Methanomethylophilaceae archaeon]